MFRMCVMHFAFSRLVDNHYKKVFDGNFELNKQFLSKLGEARSTNKAISDLIQLIKEIRWKVNKIMMFWLYLRIPHFQLRANAGKKSCEFSHTGSFSLDE